jgi:hypothetical protein
MTYTTFIASKLQRKAVFLGDDIIGDFSKANPQLPLPNPGSMKNHIKSALPILYK